MGYNSENVAFTTEICGIEKGDGIVEVNDRVFNIGPISQADKGRTVKFISVGEQIQFCVRPAQLDRISSGGHGIINAKKRGLNIGPVSPEYVGKKIEIIPYSNKAYCVTEAATDEAYPYYMFPLISDPIETQWFPLSSLEPTIQLEVTSFNNDILYAKFGEVTELSVEVSQENINSTVSEGSVVRAVPDLGNLAEFPDQMHADAIDIIEQTSSESNVETDDTPAKTTEEPEAGVNDNSKQITNQSSPDSENNEVDDAINIGDTFRAKIDRISGGGNAIASAVNSSLNDELLLGEIDVSAGETIEAVYIGGEYAISVDHVEGGIYSTSLPLPSNKVPITEPDQAPALYEDDIMDVTFHTHTNLGHAVGEKHGCMIHLPVSQSHNFTGNSPEVKIKIDYKLGKFAIASRTNDETNQKQSVKTENEPKSMESFSTESDTASENKPDIPKSKDDIDDVRALKRKRSKAEEAADESPEREVSGELGSRYTRSSAIKDYAKTRANGVCEYCEKPAPFKTDDGEPYLEAHHVDELGEGGEDHPDKVVALCPSCHKEIHYGQQGDKMNQSLRQKLDDGLAEAGK